MNKWKRKILLHYGKDLLCSPCFQYIAFQRFLHNQDRASKHHALNRASGDELSHRLMFCSFHSMIISMKATFKSLSYQKSWKDKKCFRKGDSLKGNIKGVTSAYDWRSWSPGTLQDSLVRNYIFKGSMYFVQIHRDVKRTAWHFAAHKLSQRGV